MSLSDMLQCVALPWPMLNKYYKKSDETVAYRHAMCKPACLPKSFDRLTPLTVLHPSFKKQYFASVGWEPEWIAVALSNLKNEWQVYYKPSLEPSAPSSVTPLGCTPSRDVSVYAVTPL
jgi:hypothetical protein